MLPELGDLPNFLFAKWREGCFTTEGTEIRR
jgi:hypothetical protein